MELTIGHAKADRPTWATSGQGADGDALHAALCSVGFNIRWLLWASGSLSNGARMNFAGPTADAHIARRVRAACCDSLQEAN